MENHCILFVLYTRSLEYHLHVRSVNIYISLVICNDKHFDTFFREGVKIFLSHSNSFVDISFDTYMPIFKFLAPANSSANSNKQTNKQKMSVDRPIVQLQENTEQGIKPKIHIDYTCIKHTRAI